MPVERVKAHPLVAADAAKVALTRGPLVYCVESADNREGIRELAIAPRTSFNVRHDATLLSGVFVITGPARRIDAASWNDLLYMPDAEAVPSEAAKLTAI